MQPCSAASRRRGRLAAALWLAILLSPLHPANAADVDYLATDFESGVPVEFAGGSRVGSQGFAAHGFGSYLLVSQGGTNAGNAVTLTLNGLPAHASVDLEFFLAIINSWDGWAPAPIGPDLFNVEVDGVSVWRNHFSNLWLGDMVNPPPGTVTIFQTNDVGFPADGGPPNAWPDSAYRMTHTSLAHTGSVLTIRWFADGDGWQGGLNPTEEFWGLDNLRVRLNGVTQMAPRIVRQPADQFAAEGGTASFAVQVSAVPPADHAWFREALPAPIGVLGRGSNFSFGSVTLAEFAGYFVVATNLHGTATSATANLLPTANHAPVRTWQVSDQAISFMESVNITLPPDMFTDPDLDPNLTYSASGLPVGLNFDPATRVLGGIPAPGLHIITITATDSGVPPMSASDTFRLMVTGLPLKESFVYAEGGLSGQSSGDGWAGGWSVGNTYSVAAPSLDVAGLLAAGARARSTATSGNSAKRPIHPTVFTPVPGIPQTKYLSFRLRPDAAPTGWFGVNLIGPGPSLYIGKPGGSSTTNYVLENGGGGGRVRSSQPAVAGVPALLVVKYEILAGNDRCSLYVNPTPGLPEPLPGVMKFNADHGAFTNVELTGSSPFSVDELRIGDTFAEVLPSLCPPVFTAQPTNIVAPVGVPLSLVAPAAGQGPLTYQWRKNNQPILNNGPYTGADTGTLVIPSPSALESGSYDVVVTGPCDTITSQAAQVTVQGLAFLTQPQSQTNVGGASATFTVAVSSASPVSYQWRHNSTNLPNATSATLHLTNLDALDRGPYRCAVQNLLGLFLSAEAYLEVLAPPMWVTEPQDTQVPLDGTAFLSAAGVGAPPLTYQWFFQDNMLSGQTSDLLTISPLTVGDVGDYQIVATNNYGSVTSRVARVNVLLPTLSLGNVNGQLGLTWPANMTGFQLQTTTTLYDPLSWVNVNIPPVCDTFQCQVLIPVTGGHSYYRLVR